jgi:protein phosphatase
MSMALALHEESLNRTVSAARTDIGRRRPCNEDSYIADDDLSLYLVGDGVGGCAGGDVASSESVAIIHSWVKRSRATVDECAQRPSRDNKHAVRGLLKGAVERASRIVFAMGQMDPSNRGMSTTLSSLLCVGSVGFIAQVGDSRVYLVRGGRSRQLTEDHTLANERLRCGGVDAAGATRGGGRNILTRCVGHGESVEVDMLTVSIAAGDRFVICSDGLHRYLEEGELAQLSRGPRGVAAQRLVDVANGRGGNDNITVILCDVTAAA